MLFRAAALISAFLALGPSFAAAEDNVLTPAEVRAGWKLLFDGKSADQFRNYKKDSISSGWKIENGALVRADKGAGDIINLLAAAVAPSVLSAVEARNRRTGGIPPS